MRTRTIIMENEMDQAEIVLAAKAVTDDLQDMAEKIAKLEATSIMPLLDSIRLNFGQQFADQISSDATSSLQAVLDAVKVAKDQIGRNIDNMQQVVTGEGPGNDMSQNAGVPDDTSDPETIDDAPDAVDPNSELTGPVSTGSPEIDPGVKDDDVDDVFSDSPVGREAKESMMNRAVNMLREAADPDAVLLSETIRLSKIIGAKKAVMEVAKRFSVDAHDIVAIIKDRAKK